MLSQVPKNVPSLLRPSFLFAVQKGEGWLSQNAGASQGMQRNMSVNADQANKLLAACSQPAVSLHFPRPSPIPKTFEESFLGRLSLKMLMYHNKRNQLIVGGQILYDAIKEQVDDGFLTRAFGMDPNVFYSNYTFLALHVWLIIHHLRRRLDRDDKFFKQRFYNHFQHDVEKRIYQAGVQVGVSKWLRKLEAVFYSSGISFEMVLHKETDDTMESVILREYFGGDKSKYLQAEMITRYLLYQLRCLQATDDEHIMKGHIRFSRAPFNNIF